MACIFDRIVFETFRKKAVTDRSKLVIGKTYYTNLGMSRPAKFVVERVESEVWEKDNRVWWILDREGYKHFLRDHNIGASYNPWLIFDNEEVAKECMSKLKVEIRGDVTPNVRQSVCEEVRRQVMENHRALAPPDYVYCIPMEMPK